MHLRAFNNFSGKSIYPNRPKLVVMAALTNAFPPCKRTERDAVAHVRLRYNGSYE